MVARIKKYIVNIITNPTLISLVFIGKKRIINKYNLTFDLSLCSTDKCNKLIFSIVKILH